MVWLLLGILGLQGIEAATLGVGAAEESKKIRLPKVTLSPYEPSYLLASYTQPINRMAWQSMRRYAAGLRPQEIKFQFSGTFPILEGIGGGNSWLGFSYTQCAWWQAFSAAISSPFREINYQPQLFIGWHPDRWLADWRLSHVEVGLNHHSNGRSQFASRSWNRLYARFIFQHGPWKIDWKPWYRLPEGAEDDNPDISRYLGHYQLQISYRFAQRCYCYLKHHYHWHSGYGGCELGGYYPFTPILQLYWQWFTGYGESLIDYNFRQSRLGIGLRVNWRPAAES
ncbi:MAG: phospholipase A [Candidatus Symbiodolus clandestinus]